MPEEWKPKPIIVVNQFGFCKAHGDEYCPVLCSYDHRDTNSYIIMEDPALSREQIELELFDLDNRRPRNAYRCGAVVSASDAEIYECKRHKAADCGECFNWAAMIQKEAYELYARGKWLEKKKKWLDKMDP